MCLALQLRLLQGQYGRSPVPHKSQAVELWHCVMRLPAGQGGRYRGYNVAPAKGLCLHHVFYDPRVDDPRCAALFYQLSYTDVQAATARTHACDGGLACDTQCCHNHRVCWYAILSACAGTRANSLTPCLPRCAVARTSVQCTAVPRAPA